MRNADRTADTSIAGRAIWQPGGARPPTVPEGRVCGEPRCTTVLSIYTSESTARSIRALRTRPPLLGRPRLADLRVGRQLVTIADFLPKGV